MDRISICDFKKRFRKALFTGNWQSIIPSITKTSHPNLPSLKLNMHFDDVANPNIHNLLTKRSWFHRPNPQTVLLLNGIIMGKFWWYI